MGSCLGIVNNKQCTAYQMLIFGTQMGSCLGKRAPSAKKTSSFSFEIKEKIAKIHS